MICNMNCLNCIHEDCINDKEPSQEEMDYMKYIDEEIIDKDIIGISDKKIEIDVLNTIKNWIEK